MSFTIRIRGRGGLIAAEYRCPIHGVFEELVERDANGDPPAERLCRHPAIGTATIECLQESPWTISAPPVHTQFVVSATQGKSDPPPHRLAMQTRSLAEGQKFREWKKGRQKLWQDRRHARIKEVLS